MAVVPFDRLWPCPAIRALGRTTACLSLALAWLASVCLAHAGQASADLVVRVEGVPSPAEQVFCTRSHGPRAFGATVTTVCSTGAVIELGAPENMGLLLVHGGARRHWVNFGPGLPTLGWLTAPTMAGTVTGWQLLRHEDSNYVELTLGW